MPGDTGLITAIIILACIGAVLLIMIVVLAVISKREKKQKEEQLAAIQERYGLLMLPYPEPVTEENEDEDNAADFDANGDTEIAVAVDIKTGKKFYYHYNFSFFAKLIQSSSEQQERYGQILNEVHAHPKLKTSISWRQERIYSGRKRIATILFKGRRLCVAFALNPAEFENTSYRGIDMREVKRYERTPLLLKITSDRKAKYACELLRETAKRNGILRVENAEEETESPAFSLEFRDTETLIKEGLVRLKTNGDGENFEKADISELIKGNIVLENAKVEGDAVHDILSSDEKTDSEVTRDESRDKTGQKSNKNA